MEDYRLDCLKLAHDHTLRPEEVVARAKAYHDFVVGAEGLGLIDAGYAPTPLSPKVFDRVTRGAPLDPKTPQGSM